MLKRISGAALALVCAVAPALAQRDAPVWTLAQVEARYPDMSPIHIEKCDEAGDGLFDRGEMACVQAIYNQMYRER